MEVSAKLRFVRLSPQKARLVADQIRGLPVERAVEVLTFSDKKAAFHIRKTIKSAIANAENNASLSVDDLTVKEAVVNEGPRLRRYWARARGSASPIRRKMSHIRIVLTDGIEESEAKEEAPKK